MVEKVSDSAARLRTMIESAIEDEVITRDEYDKIIHIVTEDGHIDKHEQALLQQLQEMLEDGSVKFGKK